MHDEVLLGCSQNDHKTITKRKALIKNVNEKRKGEKKTDEAAQKGERESLLTSPAATQAAYRQSGESCMVP